MIKLNDSRKAFTLLELVFVIAIIGILVAAIIPRVKENSLQEAAHQLVSHIRYTQHLALNDDKYRSTDDEWYKKRWQLIFSRAIKPDDDVGYTIFSDHPDRARVAGDPDISEIATNPGDKNRLLTGGFSSSIQSDNSKVTQKLNIEKSYGIVDVHFRGGCGGRSLRLSFDYLGRPIKGDLDTTSSAYKQNRMIHSQCLIVLTSYNGDEITIAVEAETGYSHIIF